MESVWGNKKYNEVSTDANSELAICSVISFNVDVRIILKGGVEKFVAII
jgi:hypothetical protein